MDGSKTRSPSFIGGLLLDEYVQIQLISLGSPLGVADTVIISIAQLKENEMEQPIFTKSLPEYLPEFFEALTTQIYKDNLRWGDTWKERPVEGQEHRMFARFQDYYDQFKNAGTPMPWLKIAGEAFIGFIREKYTRNNPD